MSFFPGAASPIPAFGARLGWRQLAPVVETFSELFDRIPCRGISQLLGHLTRLLGAAEDLMEQDPPLVPVAWENILDVWYNYVKGHNPQRLFRHLRRGRFDTFWLDKA